MVKGRWIGRRGSGSITLDMWYVIHNICYIDKISVIGKGNRNWSEMEWKGELGFM